MGNRYIVPVICPKCNYEDANCYYAPTCGFVEWCCPECGHVIDLVKYIGITAEEASNKDEIQRIVNELFDRFY